MHRGQRGPDLRVRLRSPDDLLPSELDDSEELDDSDDSDDEDDDDDDDVEDEAEELDLESPATSSSTASA